MPGKADDERLIRVHDANIIAEPIVLARFVRDFDILAQLAAKLVHDLLLREHLDCIIADLAADKFPAIQPLQQKPKLTGADGILHALGRRLTVKQLSANAGLFQSHFGKAPLDGLKAAKANQTVGGGVVGKADHEPAHGADIGLNAAREHVQSTAAWHLVAVLGHNTIVKRQIPTLTFGQNMQKQRKLDHAGSTVDLLFPNTVFKACDKVLVVKPQVPLHGAHFAANALQYR